MPVNLQGQIIDEEEKVMNPFVVPQETISSGVLIPAPAINVPPPSEDTTNYGVTIAGATPTPYTNKVEKTTSDIESLLGQLSGKETYAQQQETIAGVDELQAE